MTTSIWARITLFLYISLLLLHDYDVREKCLISLFTQDVSKRPRIFLSLSKHDLDVAPRNLTPGEFA